MNLAALPDPYWRAYQRLMVAVFDPDPKVWRPAALWIERLKEEMTT